MKYTLFSTLFVLAATSALAGTATINFDSGVGLFTYQVGSGSLAASGGRAVFTGPNTSMLEKNGSLVVSGGTVSATMWLRPVSDAGSGVGIVMYSGDNEVAQAVCDSSGLVTLWDYIEQWRSTSFNYPGAVNNYFTLSYNASTGRATLTLNNNESSVFIEDALAGAMNVRVGVGSLGTGGFEDFSCTGPGIPDYPSDTDGDGVTDAQEDSDGTDPNDPGSRSVNGASATTVTGLNGATVSFPAGSFAGSINVAVSTPVTIPAGTVPGGKLPSQAALSLGPSGTTFSSPVTVTMPYTAASIGNINESTLTPFYYDGSGFSATGIGGVSVNTTANTVTFTTTHFSVFMLAGDPVDSDSDGTPDYLDAFPFNPNGQTDTDGDGIGDEWESTELGDLTTANETTDSDSDGVSDLREFQEWVFYFDPTDGTSELPAAGIVGLVAAAALLAAAARRRM